MRIHRSASTPSPAAPDGAGTPTPSVPTDGAAEVGADGGQPGLGQRLKDCLHGDGVKKTTAVVVGVATVAPVLVTGVAAIADAASNPLPAQNLDTFAQELPKECQNDPIAHALEQFEAGEDPYLQLQVDDLYQTVTQDFQEVAANPAAAPQVEGELVDVVNTLHPAIHVTTNEYVEAKTELQQANEDQGWFRRTFNDTDQVDRLQDRVGELEGQLVEMRGAHGAATLVLGMDDTLVDVNAQTSESEALAQAALAARSQGHDAWVQALSAQAKGHHSLAKVVDGAGKSTEATTLAAVDYREAHTNFSNRLGWVDTLSGGKSLEGNLHRAGVGQVKDAQGNLKQLQALKSQSETRLYDGINELLKTEDPQYRETRAEYDKFKPVHDQLNEVMKDSQEALDDLDDAESAIHHRNAVKMREPPYWETVTEPKYNADGSYAGTETKQVHSTAHQMWESEMRMAELRAASACNEAERSVRELNTELNELKGYMRSANLAVEFSDVKSNIDWFFGQNFSWGIWSYDSSQVDGIARDVGQLRVKLGVVQGEVDATFHPLETAVWKAIHAREGELLQMA